MEPVQQADNQQAPNKNVEAVKAAWRRYKYSFKHEKKTKFITLAAVILVVVAVVMPFVSTPKDYEYRDVAFTSPVAMQEDKNESIPGARNSSGLVYDVFFTKNRDVKVSIGYETMSDEMYSTYSHLTNKQYETVAKKVFDNVIDVRREGSRIFVITNTHTSYGDMYTIIIEDLTERQSYEITVFTDGSAKDDSIAKEVLNSLRYKGQTIVQN